MEGIGGDSGGKVLPGTKTHCDKGEKCIDISTVNYIMTQEPCIWPYDGYYAVVGVCWNATNRGLYFTNKTVHNIPHYVVIEKMYGTYGLDTDVGCWHNLHPFKCKEAKKKFAWSKCLKKVKSEMPWEAQTQEIHKSMKSDISPRKKLYLEYVNRSNQKSIKNYEDIYLEKLFELNIQEKLGSISKKKKDQLLKIHKKYKQKNKVAKGLNLKSTKETFNHEKYLDDLNKVINKELKEYKKVLSEQEYKKLFGASKDKKFDIRNTK